MLAQVSRRVLPTLRRNNIVVNVSRRSMMAFADQAKLRVCVSRITQKNFASCWSWVLSNFKNRQQEEGLSIFDGKRPLIACRRSLLCHLWKWFLTVATLIYSDNRKKQKKTVT
jgi:hypothetical protein